MTKLEVQQRVLQNGKPLDLEKFEWCEKTNTFTSTEKNLVIDFANISGCTFNTGSDCTFNTGSDCTFNTGSNCAFNTGNGCTFNTGWRCTFNTGSGCTFNTGWRCTFNTGSDCTFNTDFGCTFNTGGRCTFDTDSECTFNIYKCGYFVNNADNCIVIVRGDNVKTYSLDVLEKNKFLMLSDEVIEKEIKEVKLIDTYIEIILSEKSQNDYKIYRTQKINDYFNDINIKEYVAEHNELFAHGKTIEEAINDVHFKVAYKLGAKENAKRIIAQGTMNKEDYRLLTGACKTGTEYFMQEKGFEMDKVVTIAEAIELTKGAYLHETFVKVLKEEGYKGELV